MLGNLGISSTRVACQNIDHSCSLNIHTALHLRRYCETCRHISVAIKVKIEKTTFKFCESITQTLVDHAQRNFLLEMISFQMICQRCIETSRIGMFIVLNRKFRQLKRVVTDYGLAQVRRSTSLIANWSVYLAIVANSKVRNMAKFVMVPHPGEISLKIFRNLDKIAKYPCKIYIRNIIGTT